MSRLHVLQEKLQGLAESELVNQFVIPLLKTMGYHSVTFHGGPSEGGKDVIAWGKDKFDNTELCVAQVKLYKPTGKARDERSLSEIVTQLSQAAEKTVPYTDGQEYRPKDILFITPFVIDTRALESRFEGYQAIRHRVTIMDGAKLSQLVNDKLPAEAATLTGSYVALGTAIKAQLNNQVLLSALQYGKTKRLNQIFTDIDFFVGRVSTRLLFQTDFSPSAVSVDASEKEWRAYQRLNDISRRSLGVSILLEGIEEVQANVEHEENLRSAYIDKLASIEADLRRAQEVREQKTRSFTEAAADLARSVPELADARKRLDGLFAQRKALPAPPKQRKVRGASAGAKSPHAALNSEIAKLETLIKHLEAPLEKERLEQESAVDRVLKVSRSREELQRGEPKPLAFRFTLNGPGLSVALKAKGDLIRGEIQRFNAESPSATELRDFLLQCGDLFRKTDAVLAEASIRKAVGISEGHRLHVGDPNTRMQIPLQLLFDTRLNLCVLGEAGAGKTTSLQICASHRSDSAQFNDLVIFAPLARLIRLWRDESGPNPDRIPNSAKLEEGIATYIQSLDVKLSESDLADSFATGGGLVLVDGIDEAIKDAPALPLIIQKFAERFPKVQVITSSRMTGSYVDDIPFLGITLLPFTDEQLHRFVAQWFEGQVNGAEYVDNIRRHLARHPDVSAIVRNPLLATTLCTLAEHDVPLPESEVRLYEERMRLLLGHYDIHKAISRISSQRTDLETAAKKIALYLHTNRRRDAEKGELQSVLVSVMDLVNRPRVAEVLVSELIDPCNVLVPMTDDGRVGFGHLRYQEYLVALECTTNRAIEVVQYLPDEWWRGALVLFARMNSSLRWLLEQVVEAMSVGASYPTLRAMSDVFPRRLREEYVALINQHLKLDRFLDSRHESSIAGDFSDDDFDDVLDDDEDDA
jgi:flagellar biosynthesis chaperone FliJ